MSFTKLLSFSIASEVPLQDVLRRASHPSHQSPRTPSPFSRVALISALLLGSTLACSDPSPGNGPANSAGSSTNGGAAGQSAVAGASSAAGNQNSAAGMGGMSNLSNASGGMPTGTTAGTAGSADGSQCRADVPAGDWDANCLACAGGDPCAQCACMKCVEQLQKCDTTPGCPDIAACVRMSGCTGAECYCGTANVLACAGGTANGPCKDVMLAAPGGKAPTTADPSAGPASDALLAVNACMQDSNTCGASCN